MTVGARYLLFKVIGNTPYYAEDSVRKFKTLYPRELEKLHGYGVFSQVQNECQHSMKLLDRGQS